MSTNPEYNTSPQSAAPPQYSQQAPPQYTQEGQAQPQFQPQNPQQQAYPQQAYPQPTSPSPQYQPQPQQYATAAPPQYAQPVQYGVPQPQVIYQQPQQVMYQTSNVIVSAPMVLPLVPLTPFQTGLCDCGEDCCTFLLAWFLPCVVVGLNEEMKTGGNPGCVCSCLAATAIFSISSFIFLPCLFSFWVSTRRTDTRNRYFIAGDNCEDFLCHLCCMPCALTQEHLEIKKRKLKLLQQQPVQQVMVY